MRKWNIQFASELELSKTILRMTKKGQNTAAAVVTGLGL